MDKQIIGDWKYCPECGCDKVSYKNLNHRCCADCGQEWFTDVDYTDTVRHHLKSSKQPESHSKPSVDGDYNPVKISMPGTAGGGSGGAGLSGVECKAQVDNSWHEKGELPPVDSEIEVFTDGEEVRQIHVVWSGDDVVFGWDMGAPFVYAHFSTKAYSFRPIKSEREKFVEAADRITDTTVADNIFGALFDAGCRFIYEARSK